MANRNPIVDKWQQKTWDSVEYDIIKEDNKMTLVQTHRRELKPEDVMDDYAFAKTAVEQMAEKRTEIEMQPKKYQEWLATDYPKIQASIERDTLAMTTLMEKMETLAKPEYETVFKKGRDFINKWKVDHGYTRADRYGKIEIREKVLAAVTDELGIVTQHPIISELRAECFE